MRAGDLISDEIPTLEGNDSGLWAMQLLDEYKMRHLPVLDAGKFIGLISDEAVLELKDPEAPIKDATDLLLLVYVGQDQHVYDLVKVAAQHELSAVPILDSNLSYIGVVSIYCLIRELARIAAINDEGGILVLEVNEKDYSMAEISQIVESNGARILSANVTSTPDSTKMEVTLKLNRNNMDGVIQTFGRYDYIISASYHQSSYQDMMHNRYEELMRYLKI
jgi:CBS domain-containing protein